jgi:hypothetical protein
MILLNSAGGSAGDPTLRNLFAEFVAASSTFDVATVDGAWLDQNATFPGTNSVLASLSPAASVVTSGIGVGTYNDTSKQWNVGSTAGLSVGDYFFLSHADITAGIYRIATIPDAAHVTFVANPLNGQGNKTGISYQVAWRYLAVLGSAPLVSSSGGTQNFFKVRVADSAGNQSDTVDSVFIRDAPAGANYIAIASMSYDGTGSSNTPLSLSLNILNAWLNDGGIYSVSIANHSVQNTNHFAFGDNTTAEKTIGAAEASGLRVAAGDGMKYGRLLFRTTAASANTLGVDIAIDIDTTAPSVSLFLIGR